MNWSHLKNGAWQPRMSLTDPLAINTLGWVSRGPEPMVQSINPVIVNQSIKWLCFSSRQPESWCHINLTRKVDGAFNPEHHALLYAFECSRRWEANNFHVSTFVGWSIHVIIRGFCIDYQIKSPWFHTQLAMATLAYFFQTTFFALNVNRMHQYEAIQRNNTLSC